MDGRVVSGKPIPDTVARSLYTLVCQADEPGVKHSFSIEKEHIHIQKYANGNICRMFFLLLLKTSVFFTFFPVSCCQNIYVGIPYFKMNS